MERERFDITQEVKIVPWWAIVLAVVCFLGIPLVFFIYVWSSEPNPPPLPIQILLATMVGAILAFLAILIGYVNRDAGRRGMSRTLWTLLVIFIPNAIGFIIYFLVRNPLQLSCPGCAALVDARANFCPLCRFGLRPTCPECKSAVNPGDRFCQKCGLQR